MYSVVEKIVTSSCSRGKPRAVKCIREHRGLTDWLISWNIILNDKEMAAVIPRVLWKPKVRYSVNKSALRSILLLFKTFTFLCLIPKHVVIIWWRNYNEDRTDIVSFSPIYKRITMLTFVIMAWKVCFPSFVLWFMFHTTFLKRFLDELHKHIGPTFLFSNGVFLPTGVII